MPARSQLDGSAPAILTAATATVALLYVFRAILWPLALALVIVILIQALLRGAVRLCPWASHRAMAALFGAAALGLLCLAGLMVLPGAAELGGELPLLQDRLDRWLMTASGQLGLDEPLTVRMLIGGLDIRAVAASGLRSVRGTATGLVLTGIFVVFLLVTWQRIQRRILLAAGEQGQWPTHVLERAVKGVEAYLWIQTISGLMNAVASGLIMFAVGLEHWQFWALALFMLSYIPILGVAVGSIGPALFAMLQFPSPSQSLIIFLGIQAVAFVVGNLITPKMQATSQNIDPSAGLLAVGAWSVVWGLPGAFLAIPLTLAIIYQFSETPRLRWLAILLSHDGDPSPKLERPRASPTGMEPPPPRP